MSTTCYGLCGCKFLKYTELNKDSIQNQSTWSMSKSLKVIALVQEVFADCHKA